MGQICLYNIMCQPKRVIVIWDVATVGLDGVTAHHVILVVMPGGLGTLVKFS